jgi:hypothetical protein
MLNVLQWPTTGSDVEDYLESMVHSFHSVLSHHRFSLVTYSHDPAVPPFQFTAGLATRGLPDLLFGGNILNGGVNDLFELVLEFYEHNHGFTNLDDDEGKERFATFLHLHYGKDDPERAYNHPYVRLRKLDTQRHYEGYGKMASKLLTRDTMAKAEIYQIILSDYQGRFPDDPQCGVTQHLFDTEPFGVGIKASNLINPKYH